MKAPIGTIQDVDVPARGGRCVIPFQRRGPDYWSIDISDDLIAEASLDDLTEALALAIQAMRDAGDASRTA